MKTLFRSLTAIAAAATALASAFAIGPAHAAKDVVFASHRRSRRRPV